MKTIEEKAKAYDEALERAKSLVKSKEIDIADLRFIFPKLAESEDEKIRKGLIKMLERAAGSSVFEATGIKKDAVLAYLEKQKENPKSADSIPSNCTANAECEDRSPKHSDSDGIDIRDTPAYWRGWDDAMKQKEQKPAWSEEDEDAVRHICRYLGYHCNEATARGCTEWLNVRLKSLRPESKKEWSEEDIEASVKSYSDSLPMCGEFQLYHDALVHAYRQGGQYAQITPSFLETQRRADSRTRSTCQRESSLYKRLYCETLQRPSQTEIAMEAPDKIYISPMPNPADGYVGIAWADAHRDMVEYIRKEALLEWAREVANDTNHSLVYRGAFRDLIDKIESL